MLIKFYVEYSQKKFRFINLTSKIIKAHFNENPSMEAVAKIL